MSWTILFLKIKQNKNKQKIPPQQRKEKRKKILPYIKRSLGARHLMLIKYYKH